MDQSALEGMNDVQRSRYRWLLQARPDQLTPEGFWRVWLIMSGRGWGKSRSAAEDFAQYCYNHPKSRLAVIAPSFASGRDVCFEGQSGLLEAMPASFIDKYNRSDVAITTKNGCRIMMYSAEKPGSLRGPSHHRAWCEELREWPYPEETWRNLKLGLRLGDHPQIIATTTPRSWPWLGRLRDAIGTHLTTGHTRDNAMNLPETTLAEWQDTYGGTRIGRQELEGELMLDVEGALWTTAMIDSARLLTVPPLDRIVVSVDPSTTHTDLSAETGIVVAGTFMHQPIRERIDARNLESHWAVLEDCSLKASPQGWADVAVRAFHRHKADRIVAEKNQGGDMVAAVLKQASPNVPVTLVTATKGKRVRAEPIAALYEQGRVHHVGEFRRLEDQMLEWTGEPGVESPDRLDALVWAITALRSGSRQAKVRLAGKSRVETKSMEPAPTVRSRLRGRVIHRG